MCSVHVMTSATQTSQITACVTVQQSADLSYAVSFTGLMMLLFSFPRETTTCMRRASVECHRNSVQKKMCNGAGLLNTDELASAVSQWTHLNNLHTYL